MPKKKEILQEQLATKKVTKNVKAKFQKASSIPKKASCSKAKVIRKAAPPKAPAYMKAHPKHLFLIHPLTRLSDKVFDSQSKEARLIGWLLVVFLDAGFEAAICVNVALFLGFMFCPFCALSKLIFL
jgi:hypothetical protein